MLCFPAQPQLCAVVPQTGTRQRRAVIRQNPPPFSQYTELNKDTHLLWTTRDVRRKRGSALATDGQKNAKDEKAPHSPALALVSGFHSFRKKRLKKRIPRPIFCGSEQFQASKARYFLTLRPQWVRKLFFSIFSDATHFFFLFSCLVREIKRRGSHTSLSGHDCHTQV